MCGKVALIYKFCPSFRQMNACSFNFFCLCPLGLSAKLNVNISTYIEKQPNCYNLFNNTHEKSLDSDWLRAMQFKCNTSAKSVTPVQKV